MHTVTVDGPPQFQAYGARCSCKWVGPTRVDEDSAELDGRVHLLNVARKVT